MRVETEYSRELDEKGNGIPRVRNVQSWNNKSIKQWINIFGREAKSDMIPRKAQSFEIKIIKNMCEERKYINKDEHEEERNQEICQNSSLNESGENKKINKNENSEQNLIVNSKESIFSNEKKKKIDKKEDWYNSYNKKPKKGVTKILLYTQLRCFDNLINIQKRVPYWGNYKENFSFHSKRIMDLQFNEIKLYSIILRCTDIKNIENANVYVLRDIINELDEFRKFYESDFEPLVLSEMHLQETEKRNTAKTSFDINRNNNEFITHHRENLVTPITDYNVMYGMKEMNCPLNKHDRYQTINEKSTMPNVNYPLDKNNSIFIVSAVEIPEEMFHMYCGKEYNKKNTCDTSNKTKLSDKKNIHIMNNVNDARNDATLNGTTLKENINPHKEQIKNIEHTMNSRNVHTKIREKRRNNHNNNNNSNYNNDNSNNNSNNNNQKIKRKRNKSTTNKTISKKRTGFYALEVDGVIASFEARKGVYYDKSRKLWRANWKENGRIQTKGFSVNEYKSVQLARQKAIEWREKKEAELLL